MIRFHGKLAVQQRVLPVYRVPFFDLLASACDGGMSLFTGLPRAEEGIVVANELRVARYTLGNNLHLFGGSFYLCHQRGLMDWLRETNPDVLVMEANPRCISTPPAVRWMHSQKKPVVGWGLGSPSPYGRGAGVRARFIRQFDAMIAYSKRGAEEYAALGFPREKIFVAHNSVSPAPSETPDRRPPTTDRVTILFVGRLQARKRVDYLLRACAEIQNVRLIIVGDGPERNTLHALAKEIYPGAEFVGSKHGAEIKAWFAEADLFVLPGTGGLAVQEAMSHGLPVIVAKGDGTQDDLVRAGNGWQVPPDDYEALVSTMKDALSDRARLRRMGDESYRIVREEINIGKMVEVFVRALNQIVPQVGRDD
jgi:glycosyltransferase involved in cell wall biosynthesis